MKKLLIVILLAFCQFVLLSVHAGGVGNVSAKAKSKSVQSPSGHLTLASSDNGLSLFFDGQKVIDVPFVGFEGASLPSSLKYVRHLKESYKMVEGKRLLCFNEANEYSAFLGKGAKLVVRLYNDGLAFRYELTDVQGSLPVEQTAYRIPDGTRRWIQEWHDSYEGFFPLTTESKNGGHWGYPALIEPVKDVFALVTEANIERSQSASSLVSDGGLYRVTPAKNDAEVKGRWHSPWRVVIAGRLSDVVESTLVTDVSEPSCLDDIGWIQPGVVSWIYWAYNHGSNDYEIIKKYVDMATALQLPYVLIDAEWDEMKDGKTIEDAVGYAKSKGVKPLIWYNSTMGWINGAPGPKFRLNKAEDREKEFAWCEQIGVAGVKIDFFSGDDQKNMEYCIDLMESAARHHLLINFHGATVPRGWQRTYPNLLTTEGVYGAEWYNNVPTFTKKAASHNATLPFTRNVVGPMDYTPCTFSDSQHPHITSNAHELALTVLFESGLQHLADRPESYFAQPQAVQRFFGSLPTVWDETRLLSGYPGESVVMARRSGSIWYVAGINGSDEERTLTLPADRLPASIRVSEAFFDGKDSMQPWSIRSSVSEPLPATVVCHPRGGFVLVLKE